MNHPLQSIFHHWRAKLGCLAAAVLIWLAVKHNIAVP